MNQLMKQPSSWLPSGIILNPSDQFRPFSFSEELQVRLEELLEKNKEIQFYYSNRSRNKNRSCII